MKIRLFQTNDRSAVFHSRQVIIVAIVAVAIVATASAVWTNPLAPFAGTMLILTILMTTALLFGCFIVFLSWWKWRSLSIIARVTGSICATILIWFGAVDTTHVFERCDHCLASRWVTNVRVLAYVVDSTVGRQYMHLEGFLASDLGVKCPHRFASWPKGRSLGMVVPFGIWNREQGDYLLGDMLINNPYPELDKIFGYDESARERLRQLHLKNPGLADEFRERVLFQCDREYFKSLLNQIRSDDPVAETPKETEGSAFDQ